MILPWIINKLETMKDEPVVLVRDALRLLPENEGAVHRFAKANGFTVIIASTNLVFRYLLEKSKGMESGTKLLVIDRAPARRRAQASAAKAPPPFYPDLLCRINGGAIIDISLRQFLVEKTNDPGWPMESDNPRFARLIADSLESIFNAHSGLRAADPQRFTDQDFRKIVAYSSLGVPEAAFKKQDASHYWRVGFFGRHALEELSSLAPDVANSVKENLLQAPAPFCWFVNSQPEQIVRAFYLATVLSQHCDQWKLMLAQIDPDIQPFSNMEEATIRNAALELVKIEPDRAHDDLQEMETGLSRDALNLIFQEQLNVTKNGRFAQVIAEEAYSTLLRCLALVAALDDLLSDTPATEAHDRLDSLLNSTGADNRTFVEQRPSSVWDNLKTAYRLTRAVLDIHKRMEKALKNLSVMKPADFSFSWFRELWNEQHLNRLEYYISDLERLLHGADWMPRQKSNLPPLFLGAQIRIQERVRRLHDESHKGLMRLNARYQEFVADNYSTWTVSDSPDVKLTSQFLRRCVKPYWDHENERAAIFIFDGMRYDIWDELARPVFEGQMEIIADEPGSSLLPSETHISRKAISAGAFPESFDSRKSEDVLLKEALKREFGYSGDVEVVAPEGSGTGETVRYRAGKLDVYIFELCDKELHNVQMRKLPDGRFAPSRPLSFIYRQHIKNIIDTEVMSIIRELEPDTKVFVAADHGFGIIGRESLRIDASWLNESFDCMYLNARLRRSLKDVCAPGKLRDNVHEFPISDLHLPATEDAGDKKSGEKWRKQFASVIFPKPGFALARPGANFNPDAYSHGGISLQEMLVPMVVLRVKTPEDGLFTLGEVQGQTELTEGEEAELRVPVIFAASCKEHELRLEAQAAYCENTDMFYQPQVQYINRPGGNIVLRFVPDPESASKEERRKGIMKRVCRISVAYHASAGRTVRKARTFEFTVHLNSEKIIRRVPPSLGKLLGMMPRGIK